MNRDSSPDYFTHQRKYEADVLVDLNSCSSQTPPKDHLLMTTRIIISIIIISSNVQVGGIHYLFKGYFIESGLIAHKAVIY